MSELNRDKNSRNPDILPFNPNVQSLPVKWRKITLQGLRNRYKGKTLNSHENIFVTLSETFQCLQYSRTKVSLFSHLLHDIKTFLKKS